MGAFSKAHRPQKNPLPAYAGRGSRTIFYLKKIVGASPAKSCRPCFQIIGGHCTMALILLQLGCWKNINIFTQSNQYVNRKIQNKDMLVIEYGHAETAWPKGTLRCPLAGGCLSSRRRPLCNGPYFTPAWLLKKYQYLYLVKSIH